MNKKEIIIGTTSINRPILHSDNIPGWYEWINGVDKNIYNLTWFINIDWIEKLGSTVEETKTNYKNIIKDIPITFLESETGKGNFLQACKRVSVGIEQYVVDNKFNLSDVIIIWLEDDWKLNPTNIPLCELITKYLSNLTSINLSFIRRNYIHALAPSIISYELWSKLHLEAWKNQTTHIDPEHSVGLHYIKNYGECIYVNNITVITKKNINEKYLSQDFLNNSKSYYTYNYDDPNTLKTDRYIKEDNLKEFNKDKITFIRITNTFCLDGVNYGRNFMKDYDLIKKRVQDEKNIDFYN